ncbi:MAG: alpha/beta fold hydrolase [Chloroflexota bacterium]
MPNLTPTEGDFLIHNFQFQGGETLPELMLHYTTLGTPKRNQAGFVDNAILILHGTTGSGQGFLKDEFATVLFGPDQLLDATKHFIILPDGIGHGQSSKPSDGLRAQFPRYGYRDMVRAHHQLLTEGLDVNHLRLIMGTSMGGMQCWLWGQTYPDFMDALLPLASLPIEIAGRNRMTRRMMIDAIRTSPDWNNGNYEEQPIGLKSAIYTMLFMISSPLQWQRQAPTQKQADELFDTFVQERLADRDANDFMYQFGASWDYNPEPDLEKIKAPLLAINSADDQVNPPELGLMEQHIQRVEKGRFILLPINEKTRGHGTHSLPAIWQHHLADLLIESAP